MSVIPEKYALLSFTQMAFIYLLVAEAPLWALSVSLSLALAQHSAHVILILPFLYVLARPIVKYRGDWYTGVKGLLVYVTLTAAITFAFYYSLLWQRGAAVWPDWGHLESVSDVIRHAVRQDYGITQLYNSESQGPKISALSLLARDFFNWNLSFLFVPLGFVALTRMGRGRYLSALWLMVLLPALAILYKTAMPAGDVDTVLGYQERYPLLVWPLITLYWGVGLSWSLRFVARFERQALALLLGPLLLFAYLGFRSAQFADNNLAEIYRDQARAEMDEVGIFWTGSDFTAFYGVPGSSGILFPVKNMIGFPWYREFVLPAISKPVARFFAEKAPDNLPDLYRRALNEGFRVVVTEPTAVLSDQGLMAMAEQTGVLWNFYSANNALYTKKIIANTLQLCERLKSVKRGLPLQGQYFLREYLKSFHFAFLSAGDYLESLNLSAPATAAREVAAQLVPGTESAAWQTHCDTYTSSLR